MGKAFKVFLVFIVLAAVVLGLSLYVAATRWQSPENVEVEIARGMSLPAIARTLTEKNVIKTPKLFEMYVRIRGISHELEAGIYDFPAGTTMMSAVQMIKDGHVRQFDFTIIEGWNLNEIAAALGGKEFLADPKVPAEFISLAHDPAFIAELGLEGVPSLEGYLFPDTYRVNFPVNAKDLIRRLVAHFNDVWNSLIAARGGDTGVDRTKVLTLASIVEKETGVPSERPLVAGVMQNRLTRGIAMQSDPTIIYGLKNYDGNIRKGDITNPHPYNTYVHKGLPPGPICNPGKASLSAALDPEKTDYLYFVSKNDGTHYFSTNLAEHMKAVRRYQLQGSTR